MSLDGRSATPSPAEYGPSPSSASDYSYPTAAELPSPIPPPIPQTVAASPPATMYDSNRFTPLERWAVRASDSQFNALAGATGGFVSGIVTCPLDVIKTKLQAQRAVHGHSSYLGVVGEAFTSRGAPAFSV